MAQLSPRILAYVRAAFGNTPKMREVAICESDDEALIYARGKKPIPVYESLSASIAARIFADDAAQAVRLRLDVVVTSKNGDALCNGTWRCLLDLDTRILFDVNALGLMADEAVVFPSDCPAVTVVVAKGLDADGVRYAQCATGLPFYGTAYSEEFPLSFGSASKIASPDKTWAFAVGAGGRLLSYALLYYGKLYASLTLGEHASHLMQPSPKRMKMTAPPWYHAIFIAAIHAAPAGHGCGKVLLEALVGRAGRAEFARWFTADESVGHLAVCAQPLDHTIGFWSRMGFSDATGQHRFLGCMVPGWAQSHDRSETVSIVVARWS